MDTNVGINIPDQADNVRLFDQAECEMIFPPTSSAVSPGQRILGPQLQPARLCSSIMATADGQGGTGGHLQIIQIRDEEARWASVYQRGPMRTDSALYIFTYHSLRRRFAVENQNCDIS